MLPVYIVIILCCMVVSAFCSSADLVYGVVDRDRLQREADAGNKWSARALKIANDYELSISAILFGNNLVNVVAESFLALIIAFSIEATGQKWLDIAISALFAVLLIIFCEFVPKAIGKRFNHKFSKLYVVPVYILKYSPTIIFVYPISKFFKLVGKLFKKKSKEEDEIDEEVLTEMVDQIEEEGMLEENEAELVRSAIDLNDIQAYEIMTPRVGVFAINVEDDIEEVLKDPEIFVHSRIPVYEDTIDNIIGILPLKLLLKQKLKEEPINVKDLIYKPIFIPRNHQVLDLLSEFKQSKIHIAVVVDEYGGTEGIVTMEDILEEIVGEIFDETDDIEELYEDKENGTYFVDGSMNLDDFFELINYDGEFETDYTTVGGLCQDVLDRFAKVGDKFDFDRFTFEVLEADEFTVERLKVVDNKYDEEEDE